MYLATYAWRWARLRDEPGAAAGAERPAGRVELPMADSVAENISELEELELVIGAHKGGDSIGEAVRRVDAQLSSQVTSDVRKLFELFSSHKQLVEQPLHFAASDTTLAVERLEDVQAIAKQLEELEQLKDQINPTYLSCASQTRRPAPAAAASHPRACMRPTLASAS